jgi:peptidoglycan hydrolase CwlO-like protein
MVVGVGQSRSRSIKQIQSQLSQLQKQVARIQKDIQRVTKTRMRESISTVTRRKPKISKSVTSTNVRRRRRIK